MFVEIVISIILVTLIVVYIRMPHIYRFHRPGCGYCKKSQNDWDAFKKECSGKIIAFHDVNMDTASNSEKELFKKYEGKGVPHIVKVAWDGSYKVYSGNRTTPDLKMFLEN